MRVACALIGLLVWSGSSPAEPVRLRIGTMAPEGSGWAREMHGFSREVAALTGGQVELKWYMGGITGDEFAEIERVKRGQLDGVGLSLGCEGLAPTLRVMRVVGLIQSREESLYVLARLRTRIEQEMARAGYVSLGLGNFGRPAVLSRSPIRNFADLTSQKIWVWDRDELTVQMLRDMGLQPVRTPVEQAGATFDERRTDAFFAVPGAALVFQWSTQARYYTELSGGLLPACFVITQRAFDALPVEQRKSVAAAAAKFAVRFEEIGKQLDGALLSRLFEKQGLKRIHPDSTFVTDFLAAARQARDHLNPGVIPPELMGEVLKALADYRAEHGSPGHR